MSYLEEYERIKGRSTSQSHERAQTEALLHIAKCLSYIVDSDINDRVEIEEKLKGIEKGER